MIWKTVTYMLMTYIYIYCPQQPNRRLILRYTLGPKFVRELTRANTLYTGVEPHNVRTYVYMCDVYYLCARGFEKRLYIGPFGPRAFPASLSLAHYVFRLILYSLKDSRKSKWGYIEGTTVTAPVLLRVNAMVEKIRPSPAAIVELNKS